MVNKCASKRLHKAVPQERPRSRLPLHPKLRLRTERPERSGNETKETLPPVAGCIRDGSASCGMHCRPQVCARRRAHYRKVGRLGTLAAKRSERRRAQGRVVERVSRRPVERVGERGPRSQSDVAGGDWKLSSGACGGGH